MKQALALSAALAVVIGGLASACGVAGGGPKIAFARLSSAEAADVYVVNADGSGQRRLTSNPEWDG